MIFELSSGLKMLIICCFPIFVPLILFCFYYSCCSPNSSGSHYIYNILILWNGFVLLLYLTLFIVIHWRVLGVMIWLLFYLTWMSPLFDFFWCMVLWLWCFYNCIDCIYWVLLNCYVSQPKLPCFVGIYDMSCL